MYTFTVGLTSKIWTTIILNKIKYNDSVLIEMRLEVIEPIVNWVNSIFDKYNVQLLIEIHEISDFIIITII